MPLSPHFPSGRRTPKISVKIFKKSFDRESGVKT